MFRLPGGSEWIIILIIVILIFGPGRIGKIAGEIGRSIRSFREGIGNKEDETGKNADSQEPK
jgi:sec-independent protein translocase protein TatA